MEFSFWLFFVCLEGNATPTMELRARLSVILALLFVGFCFVCLPAAQILMSFLSMPGTCSTHVYCLQGLQLRHSESVSEKLFLCLQCIWTLYALHLLRSDLCLVPTVVS